MTARIVAMICTTISVWFITMAISTCSQDGVEMYRECIKTNKPWDCGTARDVK